MSLPRSRHHAHDDADDPLWDLLTERARAELSAPGFDEAWFGAHTPQDGLAVVNNYAKLRAYSLWRFVEAEVEVSSGCLDFVCNDVDGLKAALSGSATFSTPGSRAEVWTSRELVRRCALHFKHFEGWPNAHVQVHIDGHGSRLRWWWWLLPPMILWQLLRHLQHYESYRDVETSFAHLQPLMRRLQIL